MVTQFTVGFSRTINLGNFQSCRVEASVVVEMKDTDDIVEQRAIAQLELRRLLEETYRAQYTEPEQKRQERNGAAA